MVYIFYSFTLFVLYYRLCSADTVTILVSHSYMIQESDFHLLEALLPKTDGERTILIHYKRQETQASKQLHIQVTITNDRRLYSTQLNTECYHPTFKQRRARLKKTMERMEILDEKENNHHLSDCANNEEIKCKRCLKRCKGNRSYKLLSTFALLVFRWSQYDSGSLSLKLDFSHV